MIMKRLKYIVYAVLFILTACIENDFPYPTVKLYITGLTAEGQVGAAVISNDEKLVTIELADSVNLKKVHILSLDVTEGGTASVPADTVVDLSNPLQVTLSMYQDYVWTIKANQTIERIFAVDGQIGQANFYPDIKEASISVPRDKGLDEIVVTELKLGPTGATYNGVAGVPELQWEKTRNYAYSKVQVKYSDFVDEEWTLYVNLSDVKVGVSSVDSWTKVAWIHGFGLEGQENGCEYKQDGAEEWIRVDASEITHDKGNFVARLIHLTPNTTYVCRAYSGSEYGAEQRFTTDAEAVLPNAGFEDWCQDGKVICPWKEGDVSFWDTGNWGSTTLSANDNITKSTTDVWNGAASGSFAAVLGSKFVGIGSIGKFAAGNLFVGEYRATDGTNGILGFGREFTARPTKLKGHFKYTTAAIAYTDAAHADLMGKPDTCIVWIALGDWNEPVEIRTNPKNSKYFDKNDPNIIAYGEMNCGETVTAYRDFEIELDYRSTSRTPKYLLIVCSASKYGDYFTGGPGATMWVDDFSFEYDYE